MKGDREQQSDDTQYGNMCRLVLSDNYAAACIHKYSSNHEHHEQGDVTTMCTIKNDNTQYGYRFSEILVRTEISSTCTD
jgi:hypothetical protein